MKNSLRLLLVASVSAIGLAFAGTAIAAYNPFLTVQQTSSKVGAPTTVGFVLGGPQTDDPSAKITIFSPAGYTSNLGQAQGTPLGKAYAFATVPAIGGAVAPLTGSVVVANKTDSTLMAQSGQCRQGQTNPTTNQAVWLLTLSLLGQNLPIPIFVNVKGPYVTMELCLPHPSAIQGVHLIAADASVKGVFTNPSSPGGYQWDGVFTPYTSPTTTGQTVEWRTLQGVPSTLTMKRVKSKPSVVTFSGKLAINGINPAGIQLHLYKAPKPLPAPNFTTPSLLGLLGSGKPVSTKKLKANGKFTITRPKVKKKTYFQMRLEDYGFQGCEGPSPTTLPLPCLGTDLAPMTSAQVKVLPPPKKKKHKH